MCINAKIIEFTGKCNNVCIKMKYLLLLNAMIFAIKCTVDRPKMQKIIKRPSYIAENYHTIAITTRHHSSKVPHLEGPKVFQT